MGDGQKTTTPRPYYEHGGITLYHGDARDIVPLLEQPDCLVVDPPYDRDDLVQWASTIPRAQSELVFTDPRHVGDVFSLWGPPVWLFTWDTQAAWNLGAARPLNRTRFCAWYGALDEYDRDAVLWGEAPPRRDHPSTKQEPLDGRRLTDLWTESLRWLHNPEAGNGSTGTSRFGGKDRQGEEAFRYAKPVGWLQCLIGNTSQGSLLDPFVGSGTSVLAAKNLGRAATGIDTDERCLEIAARRLSQEVLAL